MTGARADFDQLEAAAIELEYVEALARAIADTLDEISALSKPDGHRPDPHIAGWARQASTLLSLQMDRAAAAAKGVSAGVRGWQL